MGNPRKKWIWRNGRTWTTGEAFGQVVKTSVRNSLSRFRPSLRERTELNNLQRSFSSCKNCLGKVRPLIRVTCDQAPPIPWGSWSLRCAQVGAVPCLLGYLLDMQSMTALHSSTAFVHREQLRVPRFLSKNNSLPCHWSVHKGLDMSHGWGFIFWLPLQSEGLANQMFQRWQTL